MKMRAASNTSHAPLRHVVLMMVLVGSVGGVSLIHGPARLVSAQAVAPGWSYTGNLNAARDGHVATLLGNGQVLAAGGWDGGDINFSSAELYDPISGKWTVTSPMAEGHWRPTATLIAGGRVLIAGGNGTTPGEATSVAELYDPATATWSLAGSMATARVLHTATLLPNGKVLVTGGYNDVSGYLQSAELFDPTTQTWSSAGHLNSTRLAHTATLLPNGKVLVVGGEGDDGRGDGFVSALNSAELYDPATGNWSLTGPLKSYRLAQTATLLPNGKILVAGGYWEPCEVCYVPLAGAELYNPITGTWSDTASLNTGRETHTATLLADGNVLAVAGWNGNALNNTELYDAATGQWTISASLNESRVFQTATLLPNGKLLITGGFDSDYYSLNTAELYVPGTNPISIDGAQFFVRQHYLDFLNRDADASGLAFWTNEITSCGTDQSCIEVKRINVSAAFFLSIEFQETGYLVYRIYKASYGNLPSAPVPIRLSEFLPDTQAICQGVVVNEAGWEQTLENNKQGFTTEFVQRSRFTSAYPISLTPEQFVDQLFMTAGVTPLASDRAVVVNEFGSAATTTDTAARARALRRVAENSSLAQQEFNRAFVLMQYFGYLRRNPNDPPELTLDFQGYNFWLAKLDQFHGDFAAADMVKAFLVSTEYRQRFGQP
jgi:N-acetylneuraminic acid mutarotase